MYPDAQRAAEIRFALASRNHELPGDRSIVSVGFADDRQSPDVALDAVQRAVNQDHVFALVPVMTTTLEGEVASSLNDHRIPTFGLGVAFGYCGAQNGYVFGITGCMVPDPMVYASNAWSELVDVLLRAIGKRGAAGKTVALFVDGSPLGRARAAEVRASAEASGLRVVYDRSMTASPLPDAAVSSTVREIMTSDSGHAPDILYLGVPGSDVARINGALIHSGFRGVQTNADLYGPQLADVATGGSAYTQFATPEAAAPAMQDIVSALHAGGMTSIGPSALAGWFAADQFVRILQRAGRNLTPQRVRSVASRFRYEVPGVIGPTVYPAGYRAATPCGQLVTSDGVKWTVTAPYECADIVTRKGADTVTPRYPGGVRAPAKRGAQ
jgi:ABC-type branched-subunit amino acid transport system substrate-binding protein